jgi:hypothetical protein
MRPNAVANTSRDLGVEDGTVDATVSDRMPIER